MMVHSLYSLLKDKIQYKNSHKYVVKSIYKDENEDYKIVCETLSEGVIISFKLCDLINEDKLRYFSSHDIIKLSSLVNSPEKEFSKNNEDYKYYNLISLAFVICFITANIAATKIFSIGDIHLPAGIIIFPLVYVLNDTITEVYGFTASRKVIWSALLCNLVMTMLLVLASFLPPSDHWHNQEGFESVFLMSPRIFIASISSYLVGEGINAFIISNLKLKFNGRYFITRAIFSTSIGVFLETFIFATISFSGYLNITEIIHMVIMMSTIKVLYELCVMPLTVKFVAFLKKEEDADVFERPSIKKLLPFRI